MTRRRIATSDVRSVTVSANEILVLVDRDQFVGNLQMRRRLVVAFAARGDWHVRFQSAQRCRLCNVDMTSGALGDVLFAAVPKLQGDSLRRINPNVGLCCQLVTARAVFVYRRLRLPVTVET